MSFEHELLEQRYRKIQRLEELGFAAYPHKFAYTHTLGEIVARYRDATAEELAANRVGVRVCGRILTVRAATTARAPGSIPMNDLLRISLLVFSNLTISGFKPAANYVHNERMAVTIPGRLALTVAGRPSAWGGSSG